jgi:hypothetical protein
LNAIQGGDVKKGRISKQFRVSAIPRFPFFIAFAAD